MGALLTPIVALLIYVFLSYGTVAPCGVLQQEIMARAEAASERQSSSGDLLEQGAQALGLAIGEEALEAKLEEYSPLQCAEYMWRAKTGESSEVRRAIE